MCKSLDCFPYRYCFFIVKIHLVSNNCTCIRCNRSFIIYQHWVCRYMQSTVRWIVTTTVRKVPSEVIITSVRQPFKRELNKQKIYYLDWKKMQLPYTEYMIRKYRNVRDTRISIDTRCQFPWQFTCLNGFVYAESFL